MNDSTPSPAPCPRCGAILPADAPEGLCPRCLAALHFGPDTALTGADAATEQPPLSPEELAPRFPQLEILECLGRGGMGVVYKARQKSLNRIVALKLLAPERAPDAKFAERFTNEAHALAKLNHPHIVTVHDFGEAGGFYYLLMEYVDGVNLRQAMKAGRFTPEQALAIVPPVCEALQYAHEHGIVHRDIKPENLLLDKEGRVKIADFGIAKMLGAETSEAGIAETQAGTPQYMAPEQKEHRRTDHRADIYSLGVVLYEMLTGELPADKLRPPSSRPGAVRIDVRLDEIVLRALEKTPELRYQTAADFQTQLEAMAPDAGKADFSDPEPVTPPAPSNKARLSRAALVGAVWACVVFPAFAVAFIFVRISTAQSHWPIWWQQLIASILLPLGATAPCGAFILGWTGVAQIRRSQGRLYGLGLAVFDGMLFPLLALDFLISRGLSPILERMYSAAFRDTWLWGAAPFAITTLLLGLSMVVDLLITRRVWRAVRTEGSSAKAPWLWTGVIAAVLLLLPLTNAIRVALSYRPRPAIARPAPASSAQPKPAPNAVPPPTPSIVQPAPAPVARVAPTPVMQGTPAMSSPSSPTPPLVPTPKRTTEGIRREALLIQLRQATEAARQCEARYKMGASDYSELVAANEKVDLLKAQIDGDPARAASIRLKAAQQQAGLAEARYKVRASDYSELVAANEKVDLLKAQMEGDPARAASIRLRAARQQAGLAEARYKVGAADYSELLASREKVELLEAEIAGDAVQIAAVRLEAAERELKFAEIRSKAGEVTFLELEAARNAVELRRAELRDAKAAKNKRHHPPTPTPR